MNVDIDWLLDEHAEKIDKRDDGCWFWTAACNDKGYGRVWDGEQVRYVHRIAAGSIPDGKQVNHHCDVRNCCNPAHVYIGTQADNVADAMDRDRLSPTIDNLEPGGIADNPDAQQKAWENQRAFTDAECREMQRRYEANDDLSQHDLAAEYDYSPGTINRALNRDV